MVPMNHRTDPHSLSHQLIETQEDFEAVVREISRAPEVAVDTEQNSYFAYTTRICLVQLSIRSKSWIVDPECDIDLAILGDIFADPGCTKIFHAGENDIIQFKVEFDFSFRNIFDTMAAARILGLNRVSLAGLLDDTFGIQLEKRFQKANWGKRPLSPEMIDYAAGDTAYLLELKDILARRLGEVGREEEARCEFGNICGAVPNGKKVSPDDFLRVKGARRLDPVTQRVLRDLFLFRDHVAQRLDSALFRVAGDRVLLDAARRKPTSLRALRQIRGLSRRLVDIHGRKIVALVSDAVKKGPLHLNETQKAPAVIPPNLTRQQKRCYDALRKWRIVRAERRGVEISLVAKSSLLLEIAMALPRDLGQLEKVESLEPWRLKEYGEEIIETILSVDSPDR